MSKEVPLAGSCAVAAVVNLAMLRRNASELRLSPVSRLKALAKNA